MTPVDVRDASGIEHSIAGLTCGSNSGLIVTISPLAFLRRELIIALAARHRLPAVYAIRVFVAWSTSTRCRQLCDAGQI